MTTPYSSGPVAIFCGLPTATVANAVAQAVVTGGSAGNPFTSIAASNYPAAIANLAAVLSRPASLLGWGEVAPHRRIRRYYSNVMCDLSGPMVPMDKIRAGQDALVSVSLTKWNDGVYRSIASMGAASNLPGIESAADRGTLMMTEGQAYPLYLLFPFYNSHPAMRAQGMVPGYRFFCSMLEGDDDLDAGTQANKLHISWYCGSLQDPKTGGYGLYDYNMSAVNKIPLN